MEDYSMKTNYNERREVREINYLKEMYQKMISEKLKTQELEKMASYLAKVQKADGSWSVIDDYKVDSDIRVAYAYMPTYFATAALIAADLKVNFKKDSIEKNALVSGLIFATGRNLVGHGYDATASLLEAIAIYKNAGVYKWMRENREFAEEFCNMFEEHIQTFRHLVESGRTVSDWNRDFRKEFEKEIADYEANANPYVWYAAYGSNINRERFMEYINECTDKTEPKEDRPYMIPYELYFASAVGRWERKGVAFINDEKAGITWGRAYKITMEQFKQIQEKEGCKYEKQLQLGEIDNLPIYTFTSPFVRGDIKEAGESYLNVIKNGLKEVYADKTDLVLDTYLYGKNLSAEEVQILSFLRNSAHGVELGNIKCGSLTFTKMKPMFKKLYYYGFIVQDKRSSGQGHDMLERDAVVYTKKEKRELCDIFELMNASRR